MYANSDIWLGDAARSLARLRPTSPGAVAAVLDLLGFDWAAADAADRRSLREPEVVPADDGPAIPMIEELLDDEPYEEADIEEPEDLVYEVPLEILEPVAIDTHEGLEAWRGAAPIERVTEQHLRGIQEHQPLISPLQARSLIAATVATWDLDGPVDVPRLVDAVAGSRPVDAIPRLRRASLDRGIQLLLDVGKGMEPFARDQRELAADLKRVVGRSRVAELRFSDCPLRGAGPGSRWTWEEYNPPSPAVPVVVVTDLGIGGPRFFRERSRVWEWQALAGLLDRRGSRMIAFVPYPHGRWPQALVGSVTIVPWDRSTTISTVRRVVGQGLP